MPRTSNDIGLTSPNLSHEKEMDRISELMERLNDTELKLLSTDLDLCMTFARRAKSARSASTRERNRGNARRGYDDVSHALSRLNGGDSLHSKLETLKRALEELGEDFSTQRSKRGE